MCEKKAGNNKKNGHMKRKKEKVKKICHFYTMPHDNAYYSYTFYEIQPFNPWCCSIVDKNLLYYLSLTSLISLTSGNVPETAFRKTSGFILYLLIIRSANFQTSSLISRLYALILYISGIPLNASEVRKKYFTLFFLSMYFFGVP